MQTYLYDDYFVYKGCSNSVESIAMMVFFDSSCVRGWAAMTEESITGHIIHVYISVWSFCGAGRPCNKLLPFIYLHLVSIFILVSYTLSISVFPFFYDATLYMRKRGLCCRPVSVPPSLTFMYCIQTAKDVVKLLSRPGSTIILVFLTSSAGTQFQGFSGGAKYTGTG